MSAVAPIASGPRLLPVLARPECVLTILIGATELVPGGPLYAALLCVTLLYVLTSNFKSTTKACIRPLWPLLLLFPVGAIFAMQNNMYEQGKDVWYLSKIILYFYLAFVFGSRMRNINTFLSLYVLLGVALAMVFFAGLAEAMLSSGFQSTIDASYQFQDVKIPATLLSVPILFKYRNRLSITRHRGAASAIAFILIAHIVLTFSRTVIISTLIGFLALYGAFNNRKLVMRSLFGIGAFTTIAVIILVPMVNYSGSVGLIAKKFLHSLSEISFTNSPKDIINNWRGFEAFMAFQGFLNASLPQKILGRGFGAAVDLGIFVEVAKNMTFRYAPILHNGYFYILTKYGILGVGLYLTFCVSVIRRKLGNVRIVDKDLSNLMIGIGIVILFTTLVITGLFNKNCLDGTVMLMGGICGYSWAMEKRALAAPQ